MEDFNCTFATYSCKWDSWETAVIYHCEEGGPFLNLGAIAARRAIISVSITYIMQLNYRFTEEDKCPISVHVHWR